MRTSAPTRALSPLEFARVFFRPALDHDFLFGIELDAVPSLGMHDAEEAVFPAAEGKVRHGSGYANVDADISRRCFVAKPSCRRATRSEQRRLVAVGTALEECKRFVQVIGVDQAQHRTEDFGVSQFAGGRNAIEYGRLHEIPEIGRASCRERV